MQFAVKDTGIGISKENLSKIFESFTQADASTTRKFGGTGLGLTICQNIVKLMGGDIEVESKPNKGSVFKFNIEFPVSDNLTLKKEQTTVKISSDLFKNSELKILLAEDNPINQKLISTMLQKTGLNCDIANNGEEAVKMANEKPYNIIFMDCQMPVLDGYKATQAIKAGSMNCQTPVIALTASIMEADVSKCFDAGMDDYLAKPMKYPDLINIINKYSDKIAAEPENPNLPQNNLSDAENFDIDFDMQSVIKKIKNNLEFDEDTINSLLKDFFADLKNKTEELKIAVENSDFQTVFQISHSIKGAAGSLCLEKIFKLAENFENMGKYKDLANADNLLEKLIFISNKH